MRFRVLGPMQVTDATPSAAKVRTVLATLLVRAGVVVPVDTLLDELWPREQPKTAVTTLHVYISQLRKLLGEQVEGGARIDTRPPGYVLAVGPDDADLLRFERLHTRGVAAAAAGDQAGAARWMREALALWRGPALSGLPHGPVLEAASLRLDGLRADALERRVSADIWCGHAAELCGELAAAARECPLHERLHAHLVVALYAAGRQGDALRAYGQLRRALVEELGIEPSAALQDLHGRVLRLERVLHVDEYTSARAPGPVSGGTLGVGPGLLGLRLPRVPTHIARPQELAAAEQALRGGLTTAPATVLAVSGPAGSGSTTLAVQLARRVGDLFPDGRLLIELTGPDGAALPRADVLRRLLSWLPADPTRPTDTTGGPLPVGPAPTGPERAQPELVETELVEQVRARLTARRVLLVLDGAAGHAQLAPLLHAAGDAVVVVTSRSALTTLPDARHVPLGVLPVDRAVDLLVACGAEQVEQDRGRAAVVAELCGCLPLALRVSASWLAANGSACVDDLAARLTDPGTRLDRLASGDLDVRRSLLDAYRQADPDQQRVFRYLSAAPAKDLPAWAVAVLVDERTSVTELHLERLAHAALVTRTSSPGQPDRYGLSTLDRLLAAELLAQDAGTATGAVERLLNGYLALATAADDLLAPGRLEKVPAPPPALLLVREQVARDPEGWLTVEHESLVGAVHAAHEAGLWQLTVALSEALVAWSTRSAAWTHWATASALALDAAQRSGDRAAEAHVLCSQGELAWQRRSLRHASACFEQAQGVAKEVEDVRAETRGTIGIADIALDAGLAGQARTAYEAAIERCTAQQELRGLSDALRGLAFVDLHEGRPGLATKRLQECHWVATRSGDLRWMEFAARAAQAVRDGTALRHGTTTEIRPGQWVVNP